jgi:hypothetical protein
MVVKRAKKYALEAAFKEAIKFEKDMLSLKGNPGLENEQGASSSKNKTPQAITPYDKKRSRFYGHGKSTKNCKKYFK